MDSVGKRLRRLRAQKNKTQAQVAMDLGLQRGTYAQYEIDRREADYKTLQRMADYYNVTTDYLLGRTSDPVVNTDNDMDDYRAIARRVKKLDEKGKQELLREIVNDIFSEDFKNK